MTPLAFLSSIAERSVSFAILIGIVLLLRRPVAAKFGAHIAYALWLAPFLRLFLPELNILPASQIIITQPDATFVIDRNFYEMPAAISNGPDLLGLAALFALFIWAIVAVGMIARFFIDHHQFMKSARVGSDPVPADIAALAVPILREFRIKLAPEQVRIAHEPIGPFVAGFFRPLIVLPHTFTTNFTKTEQRLALAHELCHLKRRDLLAQLIAKLVLAAQWPNPLVHIAFRAFRRDQEAACDVSVLNRYKNETSATTYAAALVKSATTNFHTKHALAMGQPLKERLMAIGNANRTAPNKVIGATFASIFTMAGLAATASYGQEPETEMKETIIIEDGGAENTITKKRILMFKGAEDETTLSDFASGKRTQVMEFEDSDGEKRVIRIEDGKKIVQVFDESGKLISVDVSEYNGEASEGGLVIKSEGDSTQIDFMSSGSKNGKAFTSNCVSDEGEPVLLEWKDESEGQDGEKRIEHTVICLTGDDAKPEMRAEALRKAIEHIEENAKKEQERRKKMVKELKKQLREIEKEDG